MALLSIPWNPADRQLRQFGLLCLPMFPLLAWMFTRDAADAARQGWIMWSASLGGVMAAAALVRPVVLRPVFVGLCLLLFPVGMVVGEVILATVFYGVFTPMALLCRLVGRDPLKRRLDPTAATYWEPRQQPRNAARYFCQY